MVYEIIIFIDLLTYLNITNGKFIKNSFKIKSQRNKNNNVMLFSQII